MKRCIRNCLLVLLASVLLLSLGCSSPLTVTTPSPIEITDQLGRVVKLDKIPERIISLAPSNTEILYALGLADKLVGVTDYCNYPPEVKEKESIGGFSTPNIEKIIALAPDLIVAASLHQKTVIPNLEARGMTVFALAPKTVNEVLQAITLTGEITGAEKEASRLVTEMSKRMKAITDKTNNLAETQKPRVFYVTRAEPLYSVGANNLIHELITSAGGTNVFQDLSGTVTVSLEAVIQANPQVIIAGSQMGQAMPAFQFMKTDDRLRGIDARTNNRIYEIDVDTISRAGPRLVDALEELAKMIQPEIFGPLAN
ncbi:MAG: ABC transporter substrate-binding protein [Chloroflexota bacterium]